VTPATDLKSHIPLFKSGHFISAPVKRLAEALTEINDRVDEIMLQGGRGQCCLFSDEMLEVVMAHHTPDQNLATRVMPY
jgi:hypothetical protein